jgi:hypothetical protein
MSSADTSQLCAELDRLAGEFAGEIGGLATEEDIRLAQARYLGKKGKVSDLMKARFVVLVRPDDALICLSCSGTSMNIYYALREARAKKIPCALVTSQWYDAELHANADLTVSVPSEHYGIIEDCHMAIGHWLTEALCSR